MDLPALKPSQEDPQEQQEEQVTRSVIVKHQTGSAIVKQDTGSVLGLDKFTLERKLLFYEAARKLWPNISEMCRTVGIHPGTYYNHLKSDKNFAAEMRLIDLEVTDRIEGVLASQAVQPKSFLDRISYLRAHRPELYDRAKVVKIEGYKMDSTEKAQRMKTIDTAVDAEIVKTYLTKKERREQKKITGS
jgi:hypothetical protein